MERCINMRRKNWINTSLFFLPALVIYVLFFLYPAIESFRLSFFRLTGLGVKKQFIGLANFKEILLYDRIFWSSVGNTVIIIVVGGILIFATALFFATVFSRFKIKGKSFFKTVIILPISISHIAIGVGWTFIYNGRWGLLNSTLRAIGLEELAKPWLGFPEFAIPAMIVVIFWMQTGFYTLLLLAGMESIPTVYEEAAIIDGANNWQVFTKILFPLLRGVFVTSLLYWIISIFKIFGVIWALTGGGQSSRPYVVAVYVFQLAFGSQSANFRFGYGTAVAVLLFLFSVGFSILYFRLVSRKEIQY